MKESYSNYIMYGILALVIATLLFSIGSFLGLKMPITGAHSTEIKHAEQSISMFSGAKMTSFDVEVAKRNMDKDGDGKCDFCGMPVEMCIDSGEIECGMNPDAKIGKLKSAHIHADFKVYLNGKMFNFNDEKYFVKSSFVHVEREKNSDETGNVLHIHATGVPLSMFFESIGLNLDAPRLIVNGEKRDFDAYVTEDQDKILVTMSDDDLMRQELNSITDYAKNH